MLPMLGPFTLCLNSLNTTLGHHITWQSVVTQKQFSQPPMDASYKRILPLPSVHWSSLDDLKRMKELFEEKVLTNLEFWDKERILVMLSDGG